MHILSNMSDEKFVHRVRAVGIKLTKYTKRQNSYLDVAYKGDVQMEPIAWCTDLSPTLGASIFFLHRLRLTGFEKVMREAEQAMIKIGKAFCDNSKGVNVTVNGVAIAYAPGASLREVGSQIFHAMKLLPMIYIWEYFARPTALEVVRRLIQSGARSEAQEILRANGAATDARAAAAAASDGSDAAILAALAVWALPAALTQRRTVDKINDSFVGMMERHADFKDKHWYLSLEPMIWNSGGSAPEYSYDFSLLGWFTSFPQKFAVFAGSKPVERLINKTSRSELDDYVRSLGSTARDSFVESTDKHDPESNMHPLVLDHTG